MKSMTFVAAAALAINFSTVQFAWAGDDADLIKSAESAAPAAVSSNRLLKN